MYVLSIISFLLLGGFLLFAAMRFGIPSMVSDVYYQLQKCTGSEVIGDKEIELMGKSILKATMDKPEIEDILQCSLNLHKNKKIENCKIYFDHYDDFVQLYHYVLVFLV